MKWTEKLILRIEKGLKEDENHIEMALKPKELGNLKINLKDSVSPVLIEDASDKNSYYVIMPMKI